MSARGGSWVGLVLISVSTLVSSGAAHGSQSISAHPAPSAIAGANCTVGLGALYPAYDSANRLIYVPNLNSANVSVVNGTCGVVGSITLPNGSNPLAAAYDPLNKDIYVTDASHYTRPSVYVIHNLTLVHTIHNASFAGGTWAIAWDPSAKLILCVTYHGLLVGINGTSITGSIPVAKFYSQPMAMAFDPRANEILVALRAYGNVTGVNASHPFLGTHLNIPVGKFPEGIASDPATGYDYVTISGASTVAVINGTGSTFGTIPVGGQPVGVAVDPVKHEVFVANRLSNNVSVIRGLSVVRTLTSFPVPKDYLWGVVYDPSSKLVYVTAENYKVFIVS